MNNRPVKTISRRELLRRTSALSALAAAQLAWPSWLPRLSFSTDNPRGDVLVCVFLRGGADSLNVIVPHGEAAYYTARPRLAIPRPDDAKADGAARALNLDGFFGLHPALAPVLPIFKAGQMKAIHAAGSPAQTRSHFDAMNIMERGTQQNASSGWIGRHLAALETPNAPLVRAIGWGDALQFSLRGSVNAVSIKSIVDYHLGGRKEASEAMLKALNAMYSAGDESMRLAGEQTQAVLNLVSRINVADYKAEGGATYNDQNEFDLALMQTAALIKADVGLEVSAVDLGGWDTHEGQANDLTANLTTLAKGLAAFHADMGQRMQKITVVIMSEFGRRVAENASNGTDHGFGGAMLLVGGHLTGDPVFAQWPGLSREQLTSGDLAITTDYRDVLAEVVRKRLKNPNVAAVFPSFDPKDRGLLAE